MFDQRARDPDSSKRGLRKRKLLAPNPSRRRSIPVIQVTQRMSSRRQFLGSLSLVGAALPHITSRSSAAEPKAEDANQRQAWVTMLTRVAEPVLASMAANELKLRMPVEGRKAAERR